jgi:ABC-type branched-subunit amino acid transport system substrate-binding protein
LIDTNVWLVRRSLSIHLEYCPQVGYKRPQDAIRAGDRWTGRRISQVRLRETEALVNQNGRVSVRVVVLHALLVLALATGTALAAKKYGPGVTDTEIKLGQTMPYSGPASAYSNYGKLETGYFQMINDRGGINGRKVRLISLDDGFSPPKTVEQTRKLIEEEQVLMIFGSLGTAPNSAIMRYLNDRKVPQIFLATAAAKFYDHKNLPWTMGILFNYQQEAALYAKYLLKTNPMPKSPCCSKTTTSEKTSSKASKKDWETRLPRWS